MLVVFATRIKLICALKFKKLVLYVGNTTSQNQIPVHTLINAYCYIVRYIHRPPKKMYTYNIEFSFVKVCIHIFDGSCVYIQHLLVLS
jgi:hypothetical protein